MSDHDKDHKGHSHDADDSKIERDWEDSSKAGTAGGAAAGAVTGAAIGSVGGPVGTVLGGIAGAITGAGSGAVADAAGHEAAETVKGRGHEGPIERGLRDAGNAVEDGTNRDLDRDGDVGKRH